MDILQPSIAYLELYALVAGVFTWANRLRNAKFTLWIDNTSARDMVNAGTSNCKNCVHLLKLLTLNNLIHNRRVQLKYVESSENSLADNLSRLNLTEFFRLAPKDVDQQPQELPEELWLASKIWIR